MGHQNLSVAFSAELKNYLFHCFDLLELVEIIALNDDIPSSSSWAIEKSEDSDQLSNQDFASMTTTTQWAAVVKMLHSVKNALFSKQIRRLTDWYH